MALQEALTAAQEAYRLATSRFEVGLATNMELRDVQTTLVQTENNLLQAETDWREAEVRLARAMGVDLAGYLGRQP
ncbi:Outer membrane efflux protein [compost metagenome]